VSVADWCNPAIQTLQPYQPGKPTEELTRELGLTDIVKLASNENPRGPGSAVTSVLERAAGSLSRYPDGSGYRLKHSLAAHLGVEVDQVTLGNGSNDVLELIARVVLSPGAQAVVSEHAFVVYPLAVVSNGGVLVTVPARAWGCDLDAMANAVNEKTRIVFIANPNNPTGTWVGAAELSNFLEQLPEQLVVVLDEAYFEYVEEPEYPDGVDLQRRFPNLVVTRTFSKIHALAALRVGYAISRPELADLMNRVRQPFNVNALGLACAEAALTELEFVRESRALNVAGMRQLSEGFDRLGVGFIPSAGNFLCVDIGRDAEPVYQDLLRRGVIVRPIAGYGLPQHLRVTVGLDEENERFLAALRELL
jgi:histidinol-phosphate aminotransferase